MRFDRTRTMTQQTTLLDAGTTSAIDAIYKAYPRKVGKEAARKAIAKALKGKSADELMTATKAFADAVKQWPEADRCFIPHPATWFNRGSYDDDPSEWQRKGAARKSEFEGAF